MKLVYKKPNLEYSIDSILLFYEGGLSDFWIEPLFLEFPQLDKNKFTRLENLNRREYLREMLTGILETNDMNEKIILYQNYWDANVINIQKALEDAFGIQLADKFNNMVGNITLNPICPRFLESNTFDIYYLNPYFDEGCAYDYFYSMKIEKKSILETLLDIYQNNSIITFMEKSYKYCLEHETEIRNQMK